MNVNLEYPLPLKHPFSKEQNPRHIDNRRHLGAFYTPLEVSQALSEWGIRSPDDLILEPCFGGCTFIMSAMAQLRTIGNPSPEVNLYGCDIDPVAFRYLEDSIRREVIRRNFVMKDFLNYTPPKENGGKVDLVIGNPPYIRHHKISESQKSQIQRITQSAGITVSGRANLWAYFVIQALRCLKEGGRLALVLPGSFLYSNYASSIRDLIERSFECSHALTLSKRLFLSEGTEETTVILLADNFGAAKRAPLLSRCVESVDDLPMIINDLKYQSTSETYAYPGHGLVPSSLGVLHEALCDLPCIHELNQFAYLNIGLVTGNTPYFVKSKSEWKELGISYRYLKYIAPKSRHLDGLCLDLIQKEEHIENDIRCLALWTPSKPRCSKLLRYLDSYPMQDRLSNSTFKRRQVWHQFKDSRPNPDAFFVFMVDQGPRLLINQAQATTTNSLYRVFFKNEYRPELVKLIALSLHSTFTQLSAEIIGHPRGSGALKLEPSDAMKLKIYLPDQYSDDDVNSIFQEVDQKIRQGDTEVARNLVDNFLYSDLLSKDVLKTLREGLTLVRDRRTRYKK